MQVRLGEVETELEETEGRRKKAASLSSGGGRTLRDSEDRFMREERLKDDLDIARRQKLELEAALLDRDARAIESRFELESREQETTRLRRRVKELETAYRLASSSSPSPAGGGGPKSAWPGGNEDAGSSAVRQKREKELEGVVDAMKRVVEKLKGENDRLRKGVSAGGEERKQSEAEKRATAEKKRADKLEEEAQGLQAKLRGFEESSQKLVQKQQQIATIRKQLKNKEDELLAMREQSGPAVEELESARRKVLAAEARIQQLETSLQHASTAAARGAQQGGRAGGEQQQQQRELDRVRGELADSRAKMQANEDEMAALRSQVNARGNPTSAGSSGQSQQQQQLQQDVSRLRDENEKLRQELSAFDLDFFEEIENLKYAHSEAVKKLRVYEGAAGRRA